MATFPKSESEIGSLASSMLAGFDSHASDFPNIDNVALATAYSAYTSAKAAAESAKGAYHAANNAKSEKLAALKALMKTDLRQAELDSATAPDNLYFIGWGPKAGPSPIAAPGAPTNLRSTNQGAGSITFNWDKPKSGGSVRNYCLYRTTADPESGLANWSLVGFFYDNQITVENQPRGVQLYYMVNASNIGGTSANSNTLPVVL